MKTMTEDELREMALATGAELIVDGKPFNAARAQVTRRTKEPEVAPATQAPEATPAPASALAPAEPTFTQADVQRMLAEQEARLMHTLVTTLSQLKQQEPSSETGMVPTGFTPQYDRDGAITYVGVKYERLQ